MQLPFQMREGLRIECGATGRRMYLSADVLCVFNSLRENGIMGSYENNGFQVDPKYGDSGCHNSTFFHL